LFTLERHPSSIDQEDGPRPYVYEVTPRGLIAKWRGSALAWPLVDGKLISDKTGVDYLCALHRKDSFLVLKPASTETRTSVYRWNGFGFSGVEDASLRNRCQAIFDLSLERKWSG
jgi:poly-gamma-glutamate synthesis protein (capsule biosynthesis protein)